MFCLLLNSLEEHQNIFSPPPLLFPVPPSEQGWIMARDWERSGGGADRTLDPNWPPYNVMVSEKYEVKERLVGGVTGFQGESQFQREFIVWGLAEHQSACGGGGKKNRLFFFSLFFLPFLNCLYLNQGGFCSCSFFFLHPTGAMGEREEASSCVST